MGLQFLLAVGIPTALGIWADQKLGTLVLFTLLGFAMGFAAGVISIVRELFPTKAESGRPPGGEEKSSAGEDEKRGDA